MRRAPFLILLATAAFPLPFQQAEGGDILRRGSNATARPSGEGGGAPSPGGVVREETAANARDVLARNTRSVADARQMQDAARAAAIASIQANLGADPLRPGLTLPNVPNGLGPGALQPVAGAGTDPALWSGADLPVQTTGSDGRIRVNVLQNAATALLRWESFNVGRETHLHFDQTFEGEAQNNWVAVNQVNDPSGVPSQILGSITAPGQVYIINRNGILFGGSSQINLRGLSASSLPVNTNLLERGILNNPDSQFLFTGLAVSAGPNGTPGFTPEAPHPDLGRYGDIIVQPGAILNSPVSEDLVGGRILLAGPNIEQGGTILTPNGQTILAAGLEIGFAPHRADDPSLRGLDTYIGAVAPSGGTAYAGTVRNTGIVDAPRGNITLAGRDIETLGVLSSSTSVSLNGRIDLLSDYNALANPESSISSGPGHVPFLFRNTGDVLIGEGSTINILPEWDSDELVASDALALRSSLNLRGGNVRFGEGSTVLVPSGDVNADAGEWIFRTIPTPASTFVTGSGRIELGTDALISVAGTTGVEVPVTQNILTVELRGAELADAPLQREGALRGVPINVDIRRTGTANGVDWIGTPLADVSGFVGLIERSVGELTTGAGNVRLTAGDSIVMGEGARIDVSGGWVDFVGGAVQTSRLVSGGRLIDIAEASPDVPYIGVYRGFTNVISSRWGVVDAYTHPLSPNGTRLEAGYVEGAAGGNLNLSAAAMALDGQFTGWTVVGERQLANGPTPAALSLAFEKRDLAISPIFPIHAPTPPTLTFSEAPGTQSGVPAFGGAFPADRLADVFLSPDIIGGASFGNLTLRNHGGDIILPAGTRLEAAPRGTLDLTGANILLDGDLVAPGGTVRLNAPTVSLAARNFLDAATAKVNPTPDLTRGTVAVGSGATISTAGMLVDDRAPEGQSAPYSIQGGTLQITAYNVDLAAGSRLDVSGGARVTPNGAIRFGDAGSLTLAAGRDPAIPSVLGGSLALGGELLGFSGSRPGALSLSAPAVQVGSGPTPDGVLALNADFFSSTGFSRFDIAGIGLATETADVFVPGLRIVGGTSLAPQVPALRLAPNASGQLDLLPILPAEGVRAPAELTFRSTGATDPFAQLLLVRGETHLEPGASVRTDPAGSIRFTGQTVSLHGLASAPGGRISGAAADTYASISPDPNRALPTLHLGPEARLDASGATVLVDDPRGLRSGFVLPGGEVHLQGNILAESGAVLDASGTRGTLDLPAASTRLENAPTGSFAGQPFAPATLETSGGRVVLRGETLLVSEASVSAHAGGASAAGGTLDVQSGRFYRDGETSTTADITLTVSQERTAFDPTAGPIGPGRPLLTTAGNVITGGGRIAADAFLAGGFDNLRLGGNVRFSEAVEIAARGSLRLATGGIIDTSHAVLLDAAYISLGQEFRAPVDPGQTPFLFTQNIPGLGIRELNFAPVFGSGSLEFNARHIDLGTLALLNIGQADLLAGTGDIRGNGTVNIAGDLTLEAARIFPTTANTFSLNAFDRTSGGQTIGGSVRLVSAGEVASAPLSAGGAVAIHAARIEQEGTLLAPFGTIDLGWDGTGTAPRNRVTGTSVPVAREITLGSGSVTSVAPAVPGESDALIAPYGLILNDINWIDPRGLDITLEGLPEKAINLSAQNLLTAAGSTVDTRGGGDLYGYRWVPGVGGTRDILSESNRFAIVPQYDALVAPFAPFNPTPVTSNLDGARGYINETLRAGDRIVLGESSHLPAGSYTLLPARYALLPGAVLVTPLGTPATGTVDLATGASLVSGFRADGFTGAAPDGGLLSAFEIAPASVVRERAEYVDSFANTFLAEAAAARETAPQRLPADSGRIVFSATQGLDIRGGLLASPLGDGLGSLVDINSPLDIRIGTAPETADAGVLHLDPAVLNEFGAASLLIGGRRGSSGPTATVQAASRNLTLDNAGTPLVGADIILAARDTVTLAEGAALEATGTATTAGTLLLGDAATPGSGDGALVRVSSAESAPVRRAGTGTAATAQLEVAAGATIAGTSVTLDSAAGTALDPTARIAADALVLNSGRVSLVLDEGRELPDSGGLVLAGPALEGILASTSDLAFLSYSTLDVYGAGTVGSEAFQRLTLRTPALRTFDSAGGTVAFVAENILLENPTGLAAPSASPANGGDLRMEARTLTLGEGSLAIQNAATTTLAAAERLVLDNTGGTRTDGHLLLETPGVVATSGASQALTAAGDLVVRSAAGTPAPEAAGLGADLSIEGANVTLDGRLLLPAGRIAARATEGQLEVGLAGDALLDVGGVARTFFDETRYTDAGDIVLSAAQGGVTLGSGATLNLAAQPEAGEAGRLEIAAAQGAFQTDATLLGQGGENGAGGHFRLDTASLANGGLARLDALLNEGGFTAARDYRVRTGDVAVDGNARSTRYTVSADAGDIRVSGTLDASGETGGHVALRAAGSVILEDGALIDASAATFDSAGKGGHVALEAGSATHGTIDPAARLDLRPGSRIDLAVAAEDASSARLGHFGGTLLLRAPRTADGTDVAIADLRSEITGASHVALEGYALYDRTDASNALDRALFDTISADNAAFLGTAGSSSAHADALRDRLLAANPALEATLFLLPGAEIIHRTGDLNLGTTNSNTSADWNFANERFGSASAPGRLTLRAAGDLAFFNALSDGFSGGDSLWLAPLAANNPDLPANLQSWSFRLAAGADPTAADPSRVRPLADLPADSGSLLLGKNIGAATATGGNSATTASIIGNHFQVIRTGTGDIDIAAGRNVRLLNPFAAIYTAGAQVADPTAVESPGDFVLPVLRNTGLALSQGDLGSLQQNYPVLYAMGGGNLSISAGDSLGRFTRDALGNLIPDSSRQLPGNWLYRRSHVDGAGQFGAITVGSGFSIFEDPAASTTWWVDHSNFFQTSGTLGGGHVTLTAGRDITNFDAVLPTNARAPVGTPDPARILELGGGDLAVRAGRDLSGGVYYVERGRARIHADGDITTNATRSISLGILASLANPPTEPALSWMPTTLFAGKSTFDVSARGDALLGPVANAFLLAQGVGNRFWYKTYFSTYAPDSALHVTSIGGNVTLRTATTLTNIATSQPTLQLWLARQNLLTTGNSGAAFFQPWLRLAENSTEPFAGMVSIAPPTLRVTAFTGDLNLAGSFNLAPAPLGQLDLMSAGAINALSPTGLSTQIVPGTTVTAWGASRLNLSDANPANIPGVTNPFSYFGLVGSGTTSNNQTRPGFLQPVNRFFAETGANNTVLQTQQALHAPGLLHRDDPEPARIYAADGSLSGLTFFSAKPARVLAGTDISDVALYIQNVRADQTSTVAAGRDIVAFAPNSDLRLAARTAGNALNIGQNTLAGDLQISGPGRFEVLAGRNLDLGIGPSNADGTATGLTSVGNVRNPFLPARGADLIAAAGIGPATGLSNARLDLEAFIDGFLNPATAPVAERYLAELARTLNAPTADAAWAAFESLSPTRRAQTALAMFYYVLRDAGRDFNNPDSPGFGVYDEGFRAIATLFPEDLTWQGDISLTSRQIKTGAGGDIHLIAPGGGLTVGFPVAGARPDQGILTEGGGNIHIFTHESVAVGSSRIFTLRGGNEIIWSSTGDIAAGSASRTVRAAPPTRVIIDPQTGAVQTDLSGLATGGGIGVLQTVPGVPPGDVDLIAPAGIIDAGDAGIRVSGSLNIAAVQVLNAANIQVGGTAGGVPVTTVAPPNVGALSGAAAATGATTASVADTARQQARGAAGQDTLPSIITVEVIGFGGAEPDEDDNEREA